MSSGSSKYENLECILNDQSSKPDHVSLRYLEKITNNFSDERLLGKGGTSDVYKGVLQSGQIIAVKRLVPSMVRAQSLFENEVNHLMKLKHPNIVRLLGYCYETKMFYEEYEGKMVFAQRLEMLICLEHLPKGSLDGYLSEGSSELDWHTRYKIIEGICSGLQYLHEQMDRSILHLDLKPANVLLDDNLAPKITDFGLSRLLDPHQTISSPNHTGTFGYMAPEYIQEGTITPKSDIFSLGVIILELIMGHRDCPSVARTSPECFIELELMKWRKTLEKAQGYTKLETDCQQIKRCIQIGLICANPEWIKRPTIRNIINMLQGLESSDCSIIIDAMPLADQFYQVEPEESTIPCKSSHGPSSSKSSNHGPSSGHAEAGRSTHSDSYLSATEPMAMTLQELHRITDGFSEERLLGKGGFGMVYKGVLDSGEAIAVKKLHNKPGLVEEQFKNELLNLMTIKHQNIIRLVGYCSEAKQIVDEHEGKKDLFYREERALCLEYLQGGNLEELLSDESCELDWEECYRIIEGVCQGIKHLHTGSEDPIYHLDLKPANILLDRNRIPKIGDFGLSRLLASTETFVTKTFSGTTGYMPPEYMHRRQISSKFDVFSLGVIMIEIIAGPEGYYNYKCVMSPQEFINHVTENWSLRVQAKITSTKELLEVQRCIKLALRCVEDNQAKRPTITEIVEELNMISQYALFDADAIEMKPPSQH